MNNKNLIQEIKNNSHMFNPEKFKKKYPDHYNSIIEYSKNNHIEDIPFKEQIYCWVHDFNPYCKKGKKRSFISIVKGYYTGCGKIGKCSCASELYQKTNLERHGVIHPLKSSKIQDKVNKKFLEKYGTEKLSQINIDKKKETNISRYGAKTPLESKMIKDKIKETNLRNTGYETPFHNTQVQNKIKKYWNDKNGTNSYKRTQFDGESCSKKYLLDNYGTKSECLFTKESLEEELKNKTPYELSKLIGCSSSLVYKKIKLYDIEIKKEKSYYELELSNFLNGMNIKHTRNRRDIIPPKEIDIFIDDKNIGIEFNGVQWHGEKYGRLESYHKDKLDLCNKNGIDLIQIYSDEWLSNPKIIKSIIKSKLGINNKIYARNTIVKEVSENDSMKFLNNNHLQGNILGTIKRYGLYHNNELVSLMTFQVKNNVWELKRFANKIDNNIIGGASKLFKHFIKNNNPDIIFSYCDLRYFDGKIYKSLGFEYDKTTKPGYFYSKNGKRYHRLNFTKKKLVELGYDKNKTEEQIMTELGYDKIWDCGHSKWIWKK